MMSTAAVKTGLGDGNENIRGRGDGTCLAGVGGSISGGEQSCKLIDPWLTTADLFYFIS